MRLLFTLIFSLILFQTAWGQVKTIQGKLSAEDNPQTLEPIDIINQQSGDITSSDESGNFSISAQIGDTIAINSLSYKPKNIVITPRIFENGSFSTTLELAVYQLDRVVVNGFVFTGDLKKDTEENWHKLKSVQSYEISKKMGLPILKSDPEAENSNKILPEIGGVPVPLGLNINTLADVITGKYRRTKEYREERNRIGAINTVHAFFGEKYFVENLKIPKETVYEFIYYIHANTAMEKLVAEKRFEILRLQIENLAPKYLKIYTESRKSELLNTQTKDVLQPTDSLSHEPNQ